MSKNDLPESSQFSGNKPEISRLLEQANFSRAAGGRERLRKQLLETTSRPQAKQARFRLRPVLEGAGLILLLAAFFYVISGLVGGRGLTPASTGPNQSANPAPSTTTPTPTHSAYPGPATPTPYVLNPTPTSPPRLDGNSSPDEVRIAISEPSWHTLWAEMEIDTYTGGSLEQRTFSQSWLETGGRGLVQETAPMAGTVISPQGLEWRLRFLFDGQSVYRFDPSTGQVTTVQTDAGATLYPLESTSPTMPLVNPGFLMTLSSLPRLQGFEPFLNRWTVVADWGGCRLWVDAQTGLLLKAERYTGEVGNSPLESVLFIRSLALNLPLDGQMFDPGQLKILEPVPPAIPTSAPIPSPTPWAWYSPEGWVYIQTSGQVPFEWKVYSMPASCLFGKGTCGPNWQVSGNPNLQVFPAFSPDHTTALLSDTNTNQLVALDIQSRQWKTVVQGFFQLQLAWSADSRQATALGEGDGPYDDGLVLIQREGWKVQPIPSSLKGNKQILGWLDPDSIAVLIRPVDSFKGGAPAWVDQFKPGLFRVDVHTGQDTVQIEGSDAGAKGPSLSPDGRQLAFAELAGDRTVIGLSNLDGSGWHSLGVEGGLPRWSPDGGWIALESNQTDSNGQVTARLMVVRPDGTDQRTVLDTKFLFEYLWSPDSRYLVVVVRSDPTPKAYLYSMQDARPVEISLPLLDGSTAWNLLGWEP